MGCRCHLLPISSWGKGAYRARSGYRRIIHAGDCRRRGLSAPTRNMDGVLFVSRSCRLVDFHVAQTDNSYVFFGGAFVGPVISGVIVDAVSWRWFFWLAAMLQGVRVVFPQT